MGASSNGQGCVEESGVVAELEDRYENYAMLSRLFREEIDAQLLADLCESPCPEPTGNADFDEGYKRIRAYLDGVADRAKAKSELAIDYCLVFLGYGVDPEIEDDEAMRNAAYPYESVYVSGKKTLTSGLCEGVAQEFREQGFKPTRPRILADDHIACELEYLQFLIGQEILAFREGETSRADAYRDIELRFIDEHMLTWIDDLGSEIKAHAETDFYNALALMTKGWLAMDRSAAAKDE